MARARLLKPDFFEDEKLTAMPFGARLLFQAYWCLADRDGRLEDRPSRIAAFAFPPMGNEKMQAQARRDVTTWRNLLLDSGMVQRYEVDGEFYLLLVNWCKHQKIHPNEPKSVLPPPLDTNGYQETPKVANVAGSRSGIEAEAKAEAESETREGTDPIGQLCKSFGRFGHLTSTTADSIEESVGDYSLDWVQRAVKKAAASAYEGHPPWSFVESILIRWKQQGGPDEEVQRYPSSRHPVSAGAGSESVADEWERWRSGA